MIVDLLRNDLSRVSKPGTVKVPVLCGLETYANVHHLVSVITSELKDGHGVGDLIGATFPGGSITGAPKIRAMEIIAEIEQAPRGVYCGAIGYIGFNGRTDLNIAIRTAQFAEWHGARAGRRRHHRALQPRGRIRREPHQDQAHHGGLRPMILIVDNYDSFVHNVARYFEELGAAHPRRPQ